MLGKVFDFFFVFLWLLDLSLAVGPEFILFIFCIE